MKKKINKYINLLIIIKNIIKKINQSNLRVL